MKTASAISPMMRNVLSVATIPPAAVKANDMARIAPMTVPMIRPMSPVCRRIYAGVSPARSSPGLSLRPRWARGVAWVKPACRKLFGNPNPAAAIQAWPMQHPELAVLGWSAAMLVVFAPLAVHLYRRKALG